MKNDNGRPEAADAEKTPLTLTAGTVEQPRPTHTPLDPVGAARLIVAVGAHRALHGFGPSWRRAARAAGWTWTETRPPHPQASLRSHDLAERMHALRRAGLLVFTREPCSLDVTPAGRRWALATLSRERAARRRGLT